MLELVAFDDQDLAFGFGTECFVLVEWVGGAVMGRGFAGMLEGNAIPPLFLHALNRSFALEEARKP